MNISLSSSSFATALRRISLPSTPFSKIHTLCIPSKHVIRFPTRGQPAFTPPVFWDTISYMERTGPVKLRFCDAMRTPCITLPIYQKRSIIFKGFRRTATSFRRVIFSLLYPVHNPFRPGALSQHTLFTRHNKRKGTWSPCINISTLTQRMLFWTLATR